MSPLLEDPIRAFRLSARGRWQSTLRLRAAARLAVNRWREDRRRSSRAMRHALLQHRATVVASLTSLVNPAAEPTGLCQQKILNAAMLLDWKQQREVLGFPSPS